jgi:hypothetical protein
MSGFPAAYQLNLCPECNLVLQPTDNHAEGLAVAQTASRWRLTALAQIQSQSSPYRICGG